MSEPKSSEAITQPAAELADLQAEARELSPEDAENVRGGIIVQGGTPVSFKVSPTSTIQSFSWGVTNNGG